MHFWQTYVYDPQVRQYFYGQEIHCVESSLGLNRSWQRLHV